MRHVSGFRAFLVIWYGQLFSQVGSTLTAFGLSVWVYLQTGSVTSSAMVSFAYSIPVILVAPFTGVLVDRWNRRTAMLIGDAGAAVTTVVIAFLLYRDTSSMWPYYLAIAFGAVCTSLQWPAFNASVTLLVSKDDYPRANGLIQLAHGVSRVISPGLGGLLLLSIGMLGIVTIDFATFLLALAALIWVRIPRPRAVESEGEEASTSWRRAIYGWTYLRERPQLVALLAVSGTSNFVIGAVGVLVVPLVLSFASAAVLGGVLSLGGIGMVVGSVLTSVQNRARRKVPTLLVCMLLSGMAIALGGLRPSAILVAMAAFGFFLALAIFNALVQSLLQAKVHAGVQGRIFAVQTLVSSSAFPVSYLVAGPLADHVFEPLMMPDGLLASSLGTVLGVGQGRGIGLLFMFLGVLMSFAAVVAYLHPRLRRLEDEIPDVNEEEAAERPSDVPLAPAHPDEESVPAPRGGRTRWGSRIVSGLGVAALLVFVALLGGGFWFRGRLLGSLPQLDGEVRLAGLTAPLTVERDALGVPKIRAANRLDVARATGFLHAQDRFFQMDLQRRSAAGELAELFGPLAVEVDQARRRHRFRTRARRLFETADREERSLLEAYAEGVNAGLGTQDKPFEYLLLNTVPQPWSPEDSYLTLFAMFLQLQDETGRYESSMSLMHEHLPEELVAFLTPAGTQWDAPLWGEPYVTPPVPTAEVLDLRVPSRQAYVSEPFFDPGSVVPGGSNAWAVAGTLTAHGGALLANDIHQGLSVPNAWYRAEWIWAAPSGESHHLVGATLPGTPTMVIGSNTRIAWGFTNSLVDTTDLIELELDPDRVGLYRTPEGWRDFEVSTEVIRVKGSRDREVKVRSTIWGPLLDSSPSRAVRWVAYEAEAVNFDILKLETARNVDEAIELAAGIGIPVQNIIVADSAGRIAWTLAGRLPKRNGFDGRFPTSWADGSRRWDGLIPSAEHPRVIDPPSGRLWSANQRMISGAGQEIVTDGGYDLGARAKQIRDRLFELERATESDMLKLQLDDRALFLKRWRDLLMRILDPLALQDQPNRRTFRQHVDNWGSRASSDSVGYRLVREYRAFLANEIFATLTQACRNADPEFDYYLQVPAFEGPLWKLVAEQPPHFVPPEHLGWKDQLLGAVDKTIEELLKDGKQLAGKTWGERNRTQIFHPLTSGLPFLSSWLDIPSEALPGDNDMPRVQHPAAGASLRMVISPGREKEGFFHMPAGQSGHPLSSHYHDGHKSWMHGDATPFLPQPPIHALSLLPE